MRFTFWSSFIHASFVGCTGKMCHGPPVSFHPGNTRDTRAHTGTRITQTNLTSIPDVYCTSVHVLSRPRGAVGSGPVAVESAAASVVALTCGMCVVGGFGWL